MAMREALARSASGWALPAFDEDEVSVGSGPGLSGLQNGPFPEQSVMGPREYELVLLSLF
jgi:hypothetical protein